ncbi:MAG: MFS transporter [Christensenellales bacterium]|jgi:MFS family permease
MGDSSRGGNAVSRLFAYWGSQLKAVPVKHWQFSGVEFMFWFSTACSGYLTVFLQSRGMSATQVGVVGAVNFTAGIIAAPFWGMISDKMRSMRKVLILCLGVGSMLWAIVPLTAGIAVGPLMLSLLIIPVSSFFRTPANSLVESWVVQNANVHRLNYGAMRWWGSISYAAMAIGLSFVLPKLSSGVDCTFYLYFLTMIPLLILCLKIKDNGQKVKSVPLKEMNVGRLFKNYYYVVYLIFSVALNMPLNTSLSFLPFLISEVGGDSAQLGLIMGYKALLEIPMLVLMVKFRKRFPLPVIMGAAGVMYVCEQYLYSAANSMLGLVAVSTLQGLAGGIFIGTGTNYIYGLAPKELKATAQTVGGAMNSLAGIVGNLLGGYLMDQIGVRNFYLVAGTMILCALTFFAVSFPLGVKVFKRPLPLAAQRNAQLE